jgi:hypothetical protein
MLKENLTRNSSDHERIYLQLDTFLNQKLLDKEAMLVAMHLIGCEICLKRLADLLEAEKIFFLPLNPKGVETESVQKQGLSRQVPQSFSFI